MFEDNKVILNEKEQDVVAGFENKENKPLEITEDKVSEYFFVEKTQEERASIWHQKS